MATSNMTSSTPTLHSAEEGAHKEPVPAPSSPRHSQHSSSSDLSDHEKVKKERKQRVAPTGVSMQAPLEVPKWRFWCIFISLAFSIFLFALDQLIVATAIPKITAQFHSLTELPWLASGFFLTLLSFNLIYSQWNQIFPSKHVIMFAVFIFEVGSLVCGVAPNMRVLIFGRALTGVGAAGIFSGGMIIIAELTPLHNRAQYMGYFGVCFAIASVIGPLIGGAFSDHVSWRWCFYINLPFGGVALAFIIAFQPTAPPMGRAALYKGYSKEMFWQVLKCDWVGVAISMAWGCVTILFMQWGGVTKKWSDGSVIACAVLCPVLAVIFVLYEWWLGEHAMFKMALLKRRTIAGASIVMFNLFAIFMAEVYYLSVAFQAIYHSSATGAGVKLLPLILVQIVTLIASSRIIPKIQRYKWVIVSGPCFLALACGLLYTVKYGTPIAHLYGFQVILGVGIGVALQNCMLAIQHELRSEPWLISAGTGLGIFIGFAGRIIGISLAGSIFENMLQKNLHKYASQIPEELQMLIVNSATAIWDYVPENLREPALIAYTETLRDVYILGLPFAIIGLGGALLMKNSKMQSKEEEMAAIQKMKEKAALAGGAGGAAGEKVVTDEDVEAELDAQREEELAQANASVAPLETSQSRTSAAPAPAVDAQVAVDRAEGRNPV